MKSTNMKTKLFCLGIIVLILSVIADSQDVRPVRETRKKFCGSYLTDTLGIVCSNAYNTLSKKSSNIALSCMTTSIRKLLQVKF